MPDLSRRRVLFSIIFLALATPVAVGLWFGLEYGGLVFILGLFVISRAIIVLRNDGLQPNHDRAYRRFQQLQGDRGRTIWVSLVDDYGRPLSPTVAQRRLDEARARAGPRDSVIGVRRRLDSNGQPVD